MSGGPEPSPDPPGDGLRLAVIVEIVEPGWIFRRAKFIGTRIIALYDGR